MVIFIPYTQSYGYKQENMSDPHEQHLTYRCAVALFVCSWALLGGQGPLLKLCDLSIFLHQPRSCALCVFSSLNDCSWSLTLLGLCLCCACSVRSWKGAGSWAECVTTSATALWVFTGDKTDWAGTCSKCVLLIPWNICARKHTQLVI